MEWLVGRPAGWLAGWLAGCLAASPRTDQHRSTLLLSLSFFLVRISLFVRVYAQLVFGKCVVWTAGRSGETKVVSAKKKFFNARSQVTVEGGRMGHEILLFSSLFWLRFAFFGRANVILIARLSALLCEFARHFFISFPREIADVGAEEGGKPRRVSGPSAPSPRVRVRTAGETKILPPLHLFPICSVLIPRCLVYRRRLFLAREGLFHYRCTQAGNGRQVHSSQRCILARFAARICVYTYASSLIRTKPAFEV